MTEPVLVMAFNRPDNLAVLLDRLREVRPERVFVAVDGPRADRPDEVERVQACRDLMSSIDWDCAVQTLFQDANLGCGRGVTTAISWFFSQVERGIILEDDTIPDPSFFGFCTELLDRYADDERVFAITGCNVVPRTRLAAPGDPYRFSQVPVVWGWATWRRSWAQHRLDGTGWHRELPPHMLLRRTGYSVPAAAYWATEFELTARGDVDTWDWQLVCAAMTSGQLVATSNTNLVDNIGYGGDATHTVHGSSRLAPATSIELPTRAVPVVVDRMADSWASKHHYGAKLLTTIDRVRKYAMSSRGRKP